MKEKRVCEEGRWGFMYKGLVPEGAAGWPVQNRGLGTQAPNFEAGSISTLRSWPFTNLFITHVTEHHLCANHHSRCWEDKAPVSQELWFLQRQIMDKRMRREQRCE